MPADSNAVRHLITAPIKQLPRSFRVLCVFPTTAAVISQIIGVALGESGAEKRMCQTGHQFPPAERFQCHCTAAQNSATSWLVKRFKFRQIRPLSSDG